MGLGRAFGLLGTVATLTIGMYFYSLQVQSLRPSAGNGRNQEAATITGVKTDLIGIAQAERGYLATQGRYASLEELVSGNYIAIKGERPPYVYDITITAGGFSATATRTSKGTPMQIWVTENMEIQSSE